MSLICGKWQLTKKRQSGNISLFRDGERKYLLWKLFTRNFKAPCNCHLARRGRLVHRSRILSRWIPSSKRRQNCFPSPRFVSPKYAFVFVRFWKEFPLHFPTKESPFYCLQRFWTRCAKCSRCKLVAAMHRKCYWQACSKGRQCGNLAIGLGANWVRQHIIRYITNTIQSSAI